MKLHLNVPLSKTTCRNIYDSATQTQDQGHTSWPCDLPLNSVRSISPEYFERFSFNFTQMFLSVRRCAEHMVQLPKLKDTGQGQGIYP